MGKLINIDAETDANILDDGAEPTLSITNSNGRALEINKLGVSPSILTANATIAAVHLTGSSVASGALMSFAGAKTLASCSTIAFTTGGVDGTYAVRVALPDGSFGWLPILPDAAVTATVV